MENPLISVIIPVYKVEPYLKKCVDSVIAQSYKNLEIILVDDCSPDSCPQICDEYEKKDRRVKVIHHAENRGLSCARNSGIEAASGEYIGFVDSDDFINHSMIEALYSALVKNCCDIAVCSVRDIFEKDIADPSEHTVSENKTVMSGTEAVKWFLSRKDVEAGIACNKLYKTALFKDIKFPPQKLHEDEYTTFKLYFKSEKVVFIDAPLYYYLQRSTSIMHTREKSNANEDAIGAVEEFGRYCDEHISDKALLSELTEMNNVRKADLVLDCYYIACRHRLDGEKIKYESIYRSTAPQLHSKKLKFRLFEIHPRLFMLAFRVNVMIKGKKLSQFR